MKYSLEEIYFLVGREDKTAGITFESGSASQKKFGSFISVLFIYTEKERQQMETNLKSETKTFGLAKAKYLTGGELDESLVAEILAKGIDTNDIQEMIYYISPHGNTYHSKEKRTITNITIPVRPLPRGGDLNWMYGFKKKMIAEGIGLSPHDRHFYLAAKFYYEKEDLTPEEKSEVFTGEEMNEEIEWEYLGIKYVRQDINDSEKIRAAELVGIRKRSWLNILDKYLQQAGSSLKKLSTENLDQAAFLYEKISRFKDKKLNALGKKAIYLNIDSYLHIYMRHVEEFKVNAHFENKDNFQWDIDDVIMVMEKVVSALNDEIQKFFYEKPEGRYSRYGDQSYYFEGDYYTFHIESDGRISTFHKNKKAA